MSLLGARQLAAAFVCQNLASASLWSKLDTQKWQQAATFVGRNHLSWSVSSKLETQKRQQAAALQSTVESFDAIAEVYDGLFTNSVIGRAQRQSVWQEVDCQFRPGQRVLEINCGTGIDAQHLAARGIHVVACDASPAMIGVARRRLNTSASRDFIDFRTLAIEQIDQIESDGPYDGVLSNFAGLNCVENLRCVARNLARMIRPGGKAILCLFGRYCLWEMFWHLLQGNLKKAFRRTNGKGVVANLAPGHSVFVRYPSLGALRRDFGRDFRLVNWTGVGIAVPPSYLEPFAVRFPRLFRFAAKIDPWLGHCRGVRALADHVVLVFERSEI